jgi:hypothetical protein
VRRRRIPLGLVPAVIILLIAVAPAVHAQQTLRRTASVGTAGIRDVDASLAGMSATVAERVPGPGVRPLQSTPPDGVAVLVVSTWIVLVLAGVVALDRAVRARRDRAPPRRLPVPV